jgi:two-component system LytT family response regulator
VLPTSVKLVPVDQIELVRSGEAGVSVVCKDGEYPTGLTLQALETRGAFLRCHKQYLVSADAIDEISVGAISTLRTRSGHEVPVGRRYLPSLRAQLGL